MKKVLLVPALLALGSASVTLAPASAAYPDVQVSIDVEDSYLDLDDCAYHDYMITISPNAEVDDWSADVTIEGPDGQYAGSDYLYGSGFSVESGRVFLCPGTDEAGLYSIDVDLDATGADYTTVAGAYEYAFFRVRKQTPKLTVTLSDRAPRKGQPVTVTTRAWSRLDGDPVSYGNVVLQRKSRGRWINYPWSKDMLDKRGVARATGRAVQTVSMRAVLRGDDGYTGATSRPVVMRVRR